MAGALCPQFQNAKRSTRHGLERFCFRINQKALRTTWGPFFVPTTLRGSNKLFGLSNMSFTTSAVVCLVVIVTALAVVFSIALIRALPSDVPRIMEPVAQVCAALTGWFTRREHHRREGNDDEERR